jgi:hypothetical protein
VSNQYSDTAFFLKFRMKNWLLYIVLLFSVVACSSSDTTEVGGHEEVDSLLLLMNQPQDSLFNDSSFNVISKDSFLLSLTFFDINRVMVNPSDTFCLLLNGDSILFSANKFDSLRFLLPMNKNIQLLADGDTFDISTPMEGGVEVHKNIPLLEWIGLRGRIMDVDGTPHRAMPIFLHPQYQKRERHPDYSNDLSFTTDSLGYYSVTISAKARRVILRCCGFLVGDISEKEWLTYPTHNFLYNPFEVENLCGDSIPEGEFSIIVPSEGEFGWDFPEFSYTPDGDWQRFFSQCNRLEHDDLIAIQFTSIERTEIKKIRKRNAYFRNPTIRICLKNNEY